MPKDRRAPGAVGEAELSELCRDNADGSCPWMMLMDDAQGITWLRMAQPVLLSQGTALKCFGMKSVVES